MYLAEINTLMVKALREVFAHADYPLEKYRNLHVSLEYPDKRDDYPAVWVEFMPQGSVRNIGVGHHHVVVDEDTGVTSIIHRWTFRGAATFTVVAMTSLERMDIIDELIKIFAFGMENPARTQFRGLIEANELIGTAADWDEIDQRGFAVSQGTPWGTDDLLYEGTLALEIQGEFLSDGKTDELVSIGSITVTPYPEGTPDPTTEGGWQ